MDREIYSKNSIDEEMIRASIEAGMTTNSLLNVYKSNGLMGVYNLGLKNMYEHLQDRIQNFVGFDELEAIYPNVSIYDDINGDIVIESKNE